MPVDLNNYSNEQILVKIQKIEQKKDSLFKEYIKVFDSAVIGKKIIDKDGNERKAVARDIYECITKIEKCDDKINVLKAELERRKINHR